MPVQTVFGVGIIIDYLLSCRYFDQLMFIFCLVLIFCSFVYGLPLMYKRQYMQHSQNILDKLHIHIYPNYLEREACAFREDLDEMC